MLKEKQFGDNNFSANPQLLKRSELLLNAAVEVKKFKYILWDIGLSNCHCMAGFYVIPVKMKLFHA